MLWYLSEWIFAIKFNRVKNLAAKYNKHLSLEWFIKLTTMGKKYIRFGNFQNGDLPFRYPQQTKRYLNYYNYYFKQIFLKSFPIYQFKFPPFWLKLNFYLFHFLKSIEGKDRTKTTATTFEVLHKSGCPVPRTSGEGEKIGQVGSTF